MKQSEAESWSGSVIALKSEGKQYGWQTTELTSLQSTVLCHESMICDISVPGTSRANSTKLPVIKEVTTVHSDARWLSKSEHLDSENFIVSSKQSSNGDRESLERIDFGNIPLCHDASFWQGVGGYEPDMSDIESRSCVERLVRMSSYEPRYLEIGRVQAFTEDMHMDLGSSGRKRASLRSSSSEH
uniref:Predicted protein n=1 Tax=Physcomitrium patens TaxID=3218 RepID=A9U3E9_PHYPA